MKRLIVLAMMGVGLLLHAELAVSDVQVFSGKPWREVAIGYTISGTTSEPRMLQVQARDNTTGTTYDCKALTGASVEPGRHVMKWDAQADGVKVCSSNVVMTVQVVLPPPLYCIIDLSGGMTATSYPVTEMADVPTGGWTDEYKTSKLVLRRIEAGTFTMGGRSTDYPGASNSELHDVTLTKPLYIGVFEVTQRQWELVMGTKPSFFNNTTYYATRPVERVSYDMIRGSSVGAGWPANKAVDTTSFLGKLQAKTGLDFDLPTEAQWEYACRAGTTTALNSGKDLTGTDQDSNMAAVGRYYYNSSASSSAQASWTTSQGTAKVGSYAPNAWGLYDMHGNVWEWCLDWHGALSSSMAIDPSGYASGSTREGRGSGWGDIALRCCSAYRHGVAPWHVSSNAGGFRLARTINENERSIDYAENPVVFAEVSSETFVLDTTFEEGSEISNRLEVAYGNVGAGACRVEVDGEPLIESEGSGFVSWLPKSLGEHTCVWMCEDMAMTSTVMVASTLYPFAPAVAPVSGTVLVSSLTVTMSCTTDNATIHYTVDGSDPTNASPVYNTPFEISGKTTVRAVAYHNGFYSAVVTNEYALGQCGNPSISPEDGTIFPPAGQVVSIAQNGEEGVLRYTLDGTDPTPESPVYTGPFTVNESMVVKAKVFSDRYFDSAVAMVNLRRMSVTAADLRDGLIAFYSFDGTAEDKSRYLNDGQLMGGIFTPDRNGNLNSAILLDGYDDYVRIPNAPQLQCLTNTMTYSAWLKIDDWYGEWVPLFTKENSGTKVERQLSASLFRAGTKNCLKDENGILLVDTYSRLVQNPEQSFIVYALNPWLEFENWQHVVITYDGSMSRTYVNGRLAGMLQANLMSVANTADLCLGIDPPGTCEYFKGSMDEVMFYNRALSDEEVKALYYQVYDLSACTHYVDALNGNDANDGLTWATAKRTIQAAVDNVTIAGDTVLVTNGTYAPFAAERRGITIRSVNGAEWTIIDGGGTNRCATLGAATNDLHKTTLEGFTLQNGEANIGGGVIGGVLVDCILQNNHASESSENYVGGGAVHAWLDRCVVRYNRCEDDGGGVSGCLIKNSLLYGNHANNHGGSQGQGAGGGVDSSLVLNCTIVNNTAVKDTFTSGQVKGGAGASESVLVNCILWGNRYVSGEVSDCYSCKVTYSDLEESTSGVGNISVDPLFEDSASGNFQLQVDSPCRNTGLQMEDLGDCDLSGSPRVYGLGIDMGCYEVQIPENVVFDQVDGSILTNGAQIALSTMQPDSTIYYTLDGNSPIDFGSEYVGPITLTQNLVLSAVVRDGDRYGNVCTRTYYRKLLPPEIFPDSCSFGSVSQTVTMSCSEDDVEIHYTIDGTTPTVDSKRYTGEFEVYSSGTVKAVACKENCLDSEITEATFSKDNKYSEGINLLDYLPEVDQNSPWKVVTDVSHDGVSSVQSGRTEDGGTTSMKFSVRGAGRLSFWWKTACEEAWDGEYYDYGVFSVGSTPVAYLAGDSGWRQFVTNITTTGKHVLEWEYCKDDADSVPPDCLWVDQVTWVPADGSGHTLTTPEAVPYSWLVDYGLGLDSDFETAAKGMGANGWSVWQSYVAGLDPTDALSQLTADITMTNDVPYVTWSPNLNTNGEVRVYKVWGKARLDDADEEWTSPTNGTHRFFKVSVEMK